MGDKNSDWKFKIVDEHFWFTAITLAFNSFIISNIINETNNKLVIIAAYAINIYAIFLILHRAAAHADRLKYPKWISQKAENEKKFYHKGFETLIHIWISIKMIPVVIFELSGAFFYILLIIFSFLGILFLAEPN